MKELTQNVRVPRSFNERWFLLRYLKVYLLRFLLLSLSGSLVFAAAYFGIKKWQAGPTKYVAKSYYWTTYTNEFDGYAGYYLNTYTWGVVATSDGFLEYVQNQLDRSVSKESLAQMIAVTVESDVHMPDIQVTSTDSALAYDVAVAVEKAMTEYYPGVNDAIEKIDVLDGAKVSVVKPDIRVLRAGILSFVLIFFFLTVYAALYETKVDAILLPETLSEDYGLKTLGTEESPELNQHIPYLFGGRKSAWVDMASDENPNSLKSRLEQDETRPEMAKAVKEMTILPSPLLCPETAEVLHDMEAILLVVPAGEHTGMDLQRVLEFYAAQDVQVTAALLKDADEKLLKLYYRIK